MCYEVAPIGGWLVLRLETNGYSNGDSWSRKTDDYILIVVFNPVE